MQDTGHRHNRPLFLSLSLSHLVGGQCVCLLIQSNPIQCQSNVSLTDMNMDGHGRTRKDMDTRTDGDTVAYERASRLLAF